VLCTFRGERTPRVCFGREIFCSLPKQVRQSGESHCWGRRLIAVGIAAGLGAGALWGLVFVAPRIASSFGMVDITAARFVVFGAISVLAASLRPAAMRWPNARQALVVLGLSILGFSGYYLLLAFGIAKAGTEVPSLIIGTIPIWMMLLGRPAGLCVRAWLPGVLLTGAGVSFMTWGTWAAQAGVSRDASHLLWGIALALGAMASWTIYGLLNAGWLRRHPELHATDWANWLGVATGLSAILMWLLAGSDIASLQSKPDATRFIAIAIAVGFGSSWLATVLWNVASQRLPAGLCGQLIVSETIFALLYSFAWDEKWPRPTDWAAGLLFVLGVLMSLRAHRRMANQ
jgi:drug/metabolite transporter (DMT)-like permease